MLKPPVSSRLTHFVVGSPVPSWTWDSVRQLRLADGTEVIRHTLVLRPEHRNIQTLSMGPIQPHDYGRQLVVDVYRDGTAIDVIQDAPAAATVENAEIRTHVITHVRRAIAKYQAVLIDMGVQP